MPLSWLPGTPLSREAKKKETVILRAKAIKPPTALEKLSFHPWSSSWGGDLRKHVSLFIKEKTRGRRQLTLVDVGKHTTLGDGDVAKQLVQLLVIANSKLKMTRYDTGFLVVTCGISGQFEDLSG